MKPVLICQNVPRESPGNIFRWLGKRKYEVMHFSNLPKPNLSLYAGLIVLGGPDSANDKTEKMDNELEIVRTAVYSGMPYLGVCLGMQVLVKATGGEVVKNSKKEIGLQDSSEKDFVVRLTSEGKKSRIFVGLPEVFTVFQLHGETVIPTHMHTILATGIDCHVQAVQYGSHAFGIQFHTELDDMLFTAWINENEDLKTKNRATLSQDYERLKDKISEAGEKIFGNFVKLLD